MRGLADQPALTPSSTSLYVLPVPPCFLIAHHRPGVWAPQQGSADGQREFISDFVKHVRGKDKGREKAFCVGEFWKGMSITLQIPYSRMRRSWLVAHTC